MKARLSGGVLVLFTSHHFEGSGLGAVGSKSNRRSIPSFEPTTLYQYLVPFLSTWIKCAYHLPSIR